MTLAQSLPRPEYPRPQFVRERWLNLNGIWRFDFDDANVGIQQGWFQDAPLSREIVVPFPFQAQRSGIHSNEIHDCVWYQRPFEIPQDWQGSRIVLHFGAVDYRAQVWVNGRFAIDHEGGHTPFHADITALLNWEGQNSLVVRVEDITHDLHQPRGKQYWERESASIFYTRTTGIWQTVWLEPVSENHLETLRLTPDLEQESLVMAFTLAGEGEGLEIETEIRLEGALVLHDTRRVKDAPLHYALATQTPLALWSPEQPHLYDLCVQLKRGDTVLDQVSSYFGMRQIGVVDGQVRLNDQPYYMRLVLDQGYHPEGILTFPDDEAFRKDIELTKAMGFNGVRKHQKVEDPRYLYWADHLGLLVWGEMANSYAYSPLAVQRITTEWQVALQRDYNHPCIVAWVPINESWGVPDLPHDSQQRDHLMTLYYLTRSLDSTRLIISNDGWEHAKTDLLTIHDYESSGEVLTARYQTLDSTLTAQPAKRPLYTEGYSYQQEPILLTEFGGIAFRVNTAEGWGYSTAQDGEAFLRQYEEVLNAVLASPVIQGFCYTQLTDVEQEINGLLTYERQPKVEPALLSAINSRAWANTSPLEQSDSVG